MKEPHFIFGPDFASDEVARHAVSIYMNSSIMTMLLELVKEEGELSLHCTKDGFQISIGEYEFTVTQQTDFFKISLLNISTLKPGAAELLAKLSYLLFYDKYGQCKIEAGLAQDRKLMFRACMNYGLKVIADGQKQTTEFQTWSAEFAREYAEKNKSLFAFEQAQKSEKDNTPKPSQGG